ncbi:hypothetical protein K440DRAFT_637026 [Wilcoxina mikolae CBS 423.85]|nr:hypothetical protein K440DRAFT_637026 [Wilcoxina mikolae CBS 423.85]
MSLASQHTTNNNMLPTTQGALIDLLEELFSTPGISIVSESSAPIEYHTTTLLLQSARTATTPQLIELLLHILLSHPPFEHNDPKLLRTQQQRFFAIWTRNHDLASGKASAEDDVLTATDGINVLASLRPDFQRLRDSGFRFICELLLSCLQRLSPESSSRNLNIRGWVDAHGAAVTVLSELLLSIPAADWLRLDEQAECAVPLECHANEMPPDVHSIVTTLLGLLERRLGVVTSSRINAFTPSPYKFPTVPALDRHDFKRDYEIANLRVMFVSWMNAEDVHRQMEEFKAPWNMQVVLQHTEAYKKLKAHPDSAVYISHVHLQRTSTTSPLSSKTSLREELESRPEACIIANAEWCIPWLWRKRAADTQFVIVMTSAWLGSACNGPLSKAHPVFRLIEKHADNAFDVFHDLFRNVFSHEFVTNSADPEGTLRQLRKLLRIILDVTMLIKKDKPAFLNQQLSWKKACDVLISVSQATLTGATTLAEVLGSVDLFTPIILREMEEVNTCCQSHDAAELPVEQLKAKLENLTALVQFSIILARAHESIFFAFAKRSHMMSSAVQYVGTSYTELLVCSSKPELTWLHSASVGSVIELLVITGFGVNINRTPNISSVSIFSASKDDTANREEEIGRIVTVLVNRNPQVVHPTSLVYCSTHQASKTGCPNPYILFNSHVTLPLTTEQGQTLLSSRWNLSLAAKFLKFLLVPHSLCCPTCHTPLYQDISAILVLLLSWHPVWQNDLKKEAGLGMKYSFLEYTEIEKRIRELVDDGGRVEDADALMKVVECFEGWPKAKVLRKWLDREVKSIGREKERDTVEKGWYRLFRPVEGGAGVLMIDIVEMQKE